MAYKTIDVANCYMEELKKEIKQIQEYMGNGGTPTDAKRLHEFVVEANARIKVEILELEGLKKFLIKTVLGL